MIRIRKILKNTKTYLKVYKQKLKNTKNILNKTEKWLFLDPKSLSSLWCDSFFFLEKNSKFVKKFCIFSKRVKN